MFNLKFLYKSYCFVYCGQVFSRFCHLIFCVSFGWFKPPIHAEQFFLLENNESWWIFCCCSLISFSIFYITLSMVSNISVVVKSKECLMKKVTWLKMVYIICAFDKFWNIYFTNWVNIVQRFLLVKFK